MIGSFLGKVARVFIYQAARGSVGLASTVGRLGAKGAKGAVYTAAGTAGRATGQVAKAAGKTITSPFLK